MPQMIPRIGQICVVLLALAVGGCKPGGYATGQAASLTARDVHGSARLSTAERKAHVDNCVAQRSSLVAVVTAGSRLRPGGHDKLAGEVERYFPPFCDCLVSQIEDRGSKMQLLMSMSAFEQVGLMTLAGRPPDFSGFRKAALRHGMSAGAFDQVRAETAAIHSSAARQCVRHIRNA